MKKILGILVLCLLWCNAVVAVTFNEEKDKLPITPETELILITGKDNPYIYWNISYVKEAKKLGKNVEHHIVTGKHSVKSTLLKNEGFEILKEALK